MKRVPFTNSVLRSGSPSLVRPLRVDTSATGSLSTSVYILLGNASTTPTTISRLVAILSIPISPTPLSNAQILEQHLRLLSTGRLQSLLLRSPRPDAPHSHHRAYSHLFGRRRGRGDAGITLYTRQGRTGVYHAMALFVSVKPPRASGGELSSHITHPGKPSQEPVCRSP